MGGGVPGRSIAMICGPAGSLKTTLAYSVLYHNARTSRLKGLFISMEQGRESLLAHMEAFGLGPDPGVAIVDVAALRQAIKGGERPDWLGGLTAQLRRYRDEVGFDLLALDSLDALYALTTFTNPRNEIFHFVEELWALGGTAFLLVESPRDQARFGQHGVEEFLADGILHLRLKEADVGPSTTVRRYLGVVKMRGVNHPMDYYPLVVEKGRFAIVTK